MKVLNLKIMKLGFFNDNFEYALIKINKLYPVQQHSLTNTSRTNKVAHTVIELKPFDARS